jgi:hypothetical protein
MGGVIADALIEIMRREGEGEVEGEGEGEGERARR